MSHEYGVMRCACCGTYHLREYGHCPHCNAEMVMQCFEDDRHYPDALRTEAKVLRQRADAYEARASKIEGGH